jgi:hypothetical protein
MPEDVTMGELARRLDRLEMRQGEAFTEVHRQIDNLQFVHRDTYLVQMTAMSDRLETLEEKNRWMARASVTSIIFPVIVAVILALALTR